MKHIQSLLSRVTNPRGRRWSLLVYYVGTLFLVGSCTGNARTTLTPAFTPTVSNIDLHDRYVLLDQFKINYGTISSLSWSPDGRSIVMGCAITPIPIWSLDTQSISKELYGPPNSVDKVAWSPNGKYVAAGSAEPSTRFRIWEVSSGEVVHSEDLTGFVDVAWSSDGTQLAVSVGRDITLEGLPDKDSQIRVLSTGDWAARATLPFTVYVWRLAWAPDNTKLAFVTTSREPDTHRIVVWDTLRGDLIQYPVEHSDFISAVAWSPDGERLASASADGTIVLWDTASSQSALAIKQSRWINALAWSPDSKSLVSGGSDMAARVWDPDNGKLIAVLDHNNDVDTVAWSPDGRLLATAGHEGILRIWQRPRNRAE
jgi:WD40 repeat protein